ncbi:Cytochrome-c oxidase, cbb3-type subunit II [Gammaproteobacteria bacterium]
MKHEQVEAHAGLLSIFTLLAISVGGIMEITPLFFIENTVESVAGVRPYTPLELLGRDLYQREGCYVCHSQMIRPRQEDWLRYGHYSLAAESQYDHPAQWGSRRIGPDLARVGGKFPNSWHVQHLVSPRSLVRRSSMPSYDWIQKDLLETSDIAGRMRALAHVGVPYTEDSSGYEANLKKFGSNMAQFFDIRRVRESLSAEVKAMHGDPEHPTEMNALVAYLQVLGSLVEFGKYEEDYFVRSR